MIQLYKKSYEEAEKCGETDKWEASIAISRKCARAIDKAVIKFLDPMSNINVTGLLKNISKIYGKERVCHIIAAHIVNNSHDTRYTGNVRKWAEHKMNTVYAGLKDCSDKYYLRTHPIIVNGLGYNLLKRDKEYVCSTSPPEEEDEEIER